MVTIQKIAAAGRLGRRSLNGASAQQLVGTLRRPVVGLAALPRQPLPDGVQLAESAVNDVYRIARAAPGMGIRLGAMGPDAKPGAQVIDVIA
jgi:hypothetical protein